jgi:hypothetical protein
MNETSAGSKGTVGAAIQPACYRRISCASNETALGESCRRVGVPAYRRRIANRKFVGDEFVGIEIDLILLNERRSHRAKVAQIGNRIERRLI